MRGLGSASKRAVVRNVILLNGVEVVCLQESKLEDPSSSVLKEIGDTKISRRARLNAVGIAGGVLLGWNEDYFACLSTSIGSFSVLAVLENVKDRSSFFISPVYGPSDDPIKLSF